MYTVCGGLAIKDEQHTCMSIFRHSLNRIDTDGKVGHPTLLSTDTNTVGALFAHTKRSALPFGLGLSVLTSLQQDFRAFFFQHMYTFDHDEACCIVLSLSEMNLADVCPRSVCHVSMYKYEVSMLIACLSCIVKSYTTLHGIEALL